MKKYRLVDHYEDYGIVGEYDTIISCPNCHIEMTTPVYIAGRKSSNKERVIEAWNRRGENVKVL